MRLLIVEDDVDLREALVLSMRQMDFSVDTALDGQQALGMLLVDDYDLAIVDLGLPKIDGLSLLRGLRKKANGIPVLVITARDSLQDRIIGLDSGADDYLVKPFELTELAARVRALLRRHHADRRNEIVIGSLTLTPGQPRILLGTDHVDLTNSEFTLLEALVLRPGRVVRRDEISNRLSRGGEPLSDAAIDVCVHRLRRRLSAFGLVVRTVRGFGYLLEETRQDN